MVGRFLILALCVFSAYSLPVSKTASDGISIVDLINQIEGIINIHSSQLNARTSLTPTQVDNILNILNEIEGIVNIHSQSVKSVPDTGVINWPVVVDVIEKIEGALTTLKARSSLTTSQIETIINILNEIEGIVNIHSARSIPDTGVINWPVVVDVIEKIEGALTTLKARSSLTPSQVDSILNILNEIEGIVNIHSIQSRGVINIAGFLDVINQILGSSSSRSTTLTPEQIENIVGILNQIEGIVNIHSARSIPDTGVINWPIIIEVIENILNSLKARSSITLTEIEAIINILNEIEGIINIHSLKVAPEVHLSEGVVNVPVVIDVINKIEGIVGTLKIRSTLSSSDIENIINILNQIEGIINIHSAPLNARTALTPAQIENIWNLLNEIEGIINIHSIPVNPRSTTSLIDILNAIENVVQIH